MRQVLWSTFSQLNFLSGTPYPFWGTILLERHRFSLPLKTEQHQYYHHHHRSKNHRTVRKD